MKKINIILIIFMCLGMLFPTVLRSDPGDSKKKGKDITHPHAGAEKFNSTFTLPDFSLKNPVKRFNFLDKYKTKETPFRFYVRDLQLKVNVKEDAFKIQPFKDYKVKKRWGRTVLEGLGHFIYATSSYWIRQDVMKEDWEYQLTWKDQKRRFFFMDGPRFDSNTFQFNWTHSAAGAIYYNYARTNRLTPVESLLFSVGASTFWEFVVEFKEVVSINDMIGTPIGGLSIGESLFQVSRVFRDSRPTFMNKVAGFVTNPVMSLNNFFDRKKPIPKIYSGASDLWHDFRISVGSAANRISGEETTMMGQFGFEAQVMTIPEYGHEGVVSKNYNKPIFTDFQFELAMASGGIAEFNIHTKAVMFGHFNQTIQEDDHGDRTGFSYFVGGITSFEMDKKQSSVAAEGEKLPYKTDKICNIGILGPSFDLSVFYKGFTLRFRSDALFDFAMVHSVAYQQYKDIYTVENTKSTLKNHAYYYALGFTSDSLLQLNYGNVEITGKLKYHYFNSIEGLDRFQKDMLDEEDFDLRDKRLIYGLSLGYTIPRTDVQLVFTVEQTERRGWVEDFFRHFDETRTAFHVKYLF